MRIELMTSSLPRKCSTTEPQRLFTSHWVNCHWVILNESISLYDLMTYWPMTQWERKTRLELAAYSLEGYRSTKWATSAEQFENLRIWKFENSINMVLHFQIFKLANFQINKELWVEKDSNLRTRERTDLQSVAFNHSAICPKMSRKWDSNPRPADYKSAALPAELLRHIFWIQ